MSTLERIALGAQELLAVGRLLPTLVRIRPGASLSASLLVDEQVSARPDATAVLFEDVRYSWRELDREVDRWAHAFRAAGVDEGDAVPILMDNRPEYLFAVTALTRIGALAALINTNVAGQALAHAIRIVNPAMMVVGTEHAAKLREMLQQVDDFDALAESSIYEQCDPAVPVGGGFGSFDAQLANTPAIRPNDLPVPRIEDTMCFIYTSGTTGLPKAAIITHGRLIQAGALFAKVLTNAKPSDTIYMTLPLYHSTGMFAGWSNSIQSGAAIALRRRFSASKCWEDIDRFGATLFIYIGELCRYLLNQPKHPSETGHRLRLAAGNGLRPDIWQAFKDRFEIPQIAEFYGATEGNAVLVNVTGKPGMIGRLRTGLEVLRCDQESGEMIRGEGGFCARVSEGETGLLVSKITDLLKFDGYVDREASDKKVLAGVFEKDDRYFNTGDLVTLNENGWLSFADRVGDTFRWKGENVSTNEVAEILNGAPGVLESNVYGVRVPGADGRAGMASLNVDESFDVGAFAAFVLDSLPNFQRPFFVRLQRDMRITGTFKHQKVDYRKEGFDPARVGDPLYFLDEDKYVLVDIGLYQAIQSGERTIR